MGKGRGKGRGRGQGQGPPAGEKPGKLSSSAPAATKSDHPTSLGVADDYPQLGVAKSSESQNPSQHSDNQEHQKQGAKSRNHRAAVDTSFQKTGSAEPQSLQQDDTVKLPVQQGGSTEQPPTERGDGNRTICSSANGTEKPKTIITTIGSSIGNAFSQKDFVIPKRPGFGKAGQRISLRANFFPIKIPDATVYHYDVTISDGKNEDKCPKKLNRCIIERMVDLYSKEFVDRPVYDGTKNLYKKKPLNFSGMKQYPVEVEEDGKKRKFTVSLKQVNQINLQALQHMVNGQRSVAVPQSAIQALDLVLRHAASLRYIPIGAKLFTSVGAKNIGMGLEVWSGYHQSVRPTLWKTMLNIDVCATAFYRNVDVIEFLYEITKYDCTKNTSKLRDGDRKKFSKELKGLRIEITYDGKQRRKYRVNGITRESASELKFPLEKDGKTVNVTVENYFKVEKKTRLKYPWLPCLHVGNPQKNTYIPMEGCKLIPGQRCLKRLNEDQTANMIRNTAMKPDQRGNKVMQIVKDANFSQDPYLKSFGIQVDPKMTDLDGRVLATPGILYSGQGKLVPKGGAWNMKGRQLLQGAIINSWGIVMVLFDVRKPLLSADQCEKFIIELMKSCRAVGIKINNPVYKRTAVTSDSPAQIVHEAISADKNMDLLVVILPGKTQFYADLKRICETERGYADFPDGEIKEILRRRGMSTQCIQARNAMKCNPMTLAQLCLKINAKMGGMNNSIDASNKLTRPARVFKEPVIFIGADVTHPGIGDKLSPSIAAVVGSVDAIPSRYAVCVRVQKHRVEIIEDLCDITKELLKQFYRKIKKKPSRIIMFRDGVSEGQFQQVLRHEMTAMRQACTMLEKGYQPSITFIVVQKRHHARFMVVNQQDADRSGNCPPGTTIDTAVCHPSEFDFYQYSHAGIQGTSRPTHYHVLWDDLDFGADELQALSFMLCHLYVRCTRSVSIPAPAYYAHHVAFRARFHLQREDGSNSSDSGDIAEQMEALNLKEIVKPHPNLESRMYFV